MRKSIVLFLIALYAVSMFGVSVFATSGSKSGSAQDGMVSISSQPVYPYDESGNIPNRPAAKMYTSRTSMGVLASPGIQIGTTAYDIQHNSSMGRQITMGSDGRVHFNWTFTELTNPTTQGLRSIRYQSWINGVFSEPAGGSDMQDPSIREGHMCNIDVDSVAAYETWRYGAPFANYKTTTALDFGSGTNSFTIKDVTSAATGTICAGGPPSSALHYIWPRIAADMNNLTRERYYHLIGQEGDANANFGQICYYRGVGNSPFTTWPACGTWIDSTLAISYDICQDPNSDKVLVAWTKGRQSGTRDNNDIAYRLSPDLGVNWGPLVNVTNYATGAKERAFNETSTMFTSDGCFHILFSTLNYDSAANRIGDQEAKLRHWDNCNNCISLVLDANNRDANCNMNAFERNVCRYSISECSVGASKRLYATYTYYSGTTTSPDCSASGRPVGDIYASASETNGLTWGPPTNLTNSPSNGCAAGACDADNFSTSARYVTDSIRIEYINDKEAGNGTGNDGTAFTASPVMFLTVPCFSMASFRSLSSTPANVLYPELHASTGQQVTYPLTITNAGNVTANWTSSESASWLSVTAGGSCAAGCANTSPATLTAGPVGVEGLYSTDVTISYEGPTSFLVHVDFYVFNNFVLPQNYALKTAAAAKAGVGVSCLVNQASRTANQDNKNGMTFFTDPTNYFLFDGSLILGNSAQNLSWLIFEGGSGTPTPANNWGRLYATTNSVVDSNSQYRRYSGTGVNRDSSIAFDVKWYASKFADSSDFVVGHFDVYHGPKNPGTPVTGLMVGYGGDWDIPDDSAENSSGADASRNLLYQKGKWAGTNQNERKYGGFSVYLDDNSNPQGAYGWVNQLYVYPNQNFQVDSVWKYAQLVSGMTTTPHDSDLSMVYVVKKGVTIGATDHLKFSLIIAASYDNASPKSIAGLQATVDKAKKFICGNVIAPATPNFCLGCTCGDANHDGSINISDAVYLIQYIFAGGPAPNPLCQGDANGDGSVNISDAVYLIQYIFAGGPAPHCP